MEFSIITISFNSERTIVRTIESVLAQTYKDYEYIIVDGCSKDGTLDIVKKYEPLFEGRMKWKSEPDEGIYDAMNKGVRRAMGDIISIVNSDDWLEPDALENVQSAIEANGYNMDALYCGGINYHLANGKVKKWPVSINALHRDAKNYLVSGVRHPGLFVPKGVYERIGVFNKEMRLSADADFMLRCYYQNVPFIDIKTIVSNMSEGGFSTGGSQRAREQARADRKMMLKDFGKKGLAYLWLYYSWNIRRIIRRYSKMIGLYN